MAPSILRQKEKGKKYDITLHYQFTWTIKRTKLNILGIVSQ